MSSLFLNNSKNNQNSNQNKDNMSIGSAESLAPRWVSPGDTTNHTSVPGGGGGAPLPSPSSPTSRTNTSNNNNNNSNNNSNKPYSHIHWVGILRDDVMLCEYCNEPTNHKVLQMSRRFLKKNSHNETPQTQQQQQQQAPPQKVDWEFKTYAIQSQRRMVHAIQFHLYELIPMLPGARAKLQHLQSQSFLNGETVRIIEYNPNTQKYLIRPSIPLPEAQKLATTGMLVVHAKHLVPLLGHQSHPVYYTTYTIAALYDGKQLTQNLACQFIEKILILSENFRTPVGGSGGSSGGSSSTGEGGEGSSGGGNNNNNNTTSGGGEMFRTPAGSSTGEGGEGSGGGGGGNNNNNNNNTTSGGGEMSLQTSFGPILKSQMELFHLDIDNAIQNNTLSIENSLEYSKQVIERNMDIVAQLSNLHAV